MKWPSGCSISQQRIGHGPTQRLSRKMSSLRCNAERPSTPHCCANLSSAVPVGMGVTLIICYSVGLVGRDSLRGESPCPHAVPRLVRQDLDPHPPRPECLELQASLTSRAAGPLP